MEQELIVTRKQWRRRSVIAFIIFLVLMAAGICTWTYIKNLPPDNGLLGGVQPPVRKVLDINGSIFGKALRNQRLAKTYPLSAAVRHPRVNGDVGMGNDFNAATW